MDQVKAVSTLIQRFSHWMGKATTLKDNTGHVVWLTAVRKRDWHYWRRYRDFQESKLSHGSRRTRRSHRQHPSAPGGPAAYRCLGSTRAGWMPPKHKKTHVPICNGHETVPLSLRNAIQSFVLACAARELRGQGAEHSSMLVHVTRYVAVQGHVREQVEEAVRRMRQKINRGSDADELLAQMRKVWEEDFVPPRAPSRMITRGRRRPPGSAAIPLR